MRTKKIIPFDFNCAKGGATVKTGNGETVNILKFDNPGEYPICGTYEDARGKLHFDQWYTDGSPLEEIGGFRLMLEIEEVDFFPGKHREPIKAINGITPIDYETLYKCAFERAYIAESKVKELKDERDQLLTRIGGLNGFAQRMKNGLL